MKLLPFSRIARAAVGALLAVPLALAGALPAAAATGAASSAAIVAGQPQPELRWAAFTSPADGYGYFLAGPTGCTGQVGHSTDGGAVFHHLVTVHTWSCASGTAWRMELASDAHGDVFLFGAGLFASHDGGRVWSRVRGIGQVLAVAPAGRSIWLLTQTCEARVQFELCRPDLETSANGGRTWRQSPVQPFRSAYRDYQAGSGTGLGASQTWLIRTGPAAGYVILPPFGFGRPSAPLRVTRTGGRSWSAERIPCVGQTAAVTVPPGTAALAAVCAGQPGGADGPHQAKMVAVSSDRGRTWTTRKPCPLNINNGLRCNLDWGYLSEIAAPSPRVIFMTGPAVSLDVSRDGGARWHFASPPPGGIYSDTYQVQFFSRSDGLLVGVNQAGSRALAIWHTADGGLKWRLVVPSTR